MRDEFLQFQKSMAEETAKAAAPVEEKAVATEAPTYAAPAKSAAIEVKPEEKPGAADP